ncbi:LysR substrate-binding domain-containing protein [Pseudomonas sp. WAC2]|uniref:LysR substrate-binding domain-containing protein n=1 Tax=Pseudomonas sp. WAC2 TaxID=3055057 RepID=UPI0025B08A80|nr:LysR substrate-binding domain-containing protein [Pseudomonas sp. WAC2]MDN3236249.1 LysR substrate-binding domain-containing protein [Pseudomonas sp. WAC2]
MSRRHIPSITAMQCFEAVARHLSFTRAAEELNLTQSAVSKQVAQLEEQLGHPLFRRVRQRLQMTPAGSLYLSEVTKILTQIEMSTHYMRSYGGETEVLRVATPPTFGERWLIPRLKGWRLQHPMIHLDVRHEVKNMDVNEPACDVALFAGQGRWPGAECIPLMTEDMVPVCAPGLWPEGHLSDPTQLADYILLQNAARPEAWHEWFQSQGLHTEHSYHGPRFDTFTMCIRAAQVGCGVALVPRFLIDEELAEGKLVIAWPHSMTSPHTYYLGYPEHAAEVPKIRKFVAWIRERIDTPTV